MKPHYSNTINPIDFPKSKNKMNEQIEHCLYQAGLTAQGCWDELDDYAKQGIEKFAELIVRECSTICLNENVSNIDLDIIHQSGKFTVQDLATKSCGENLAKRIKEHFGVE